jgi:uncharacterized protein
MVKYEMLENIKQHSIIVARITELMSTCLIKAGMQISVETAVAGALMHDIGKTPCLGTGRDHAEEGRRICLANGLDEIAPIVGEHVRLASHDPASDYSEKEIVYYADKRVNHDRIVSLEARLAYILERYGKNQAERQQAIEENFRFCKTVERRLFQNLDFRPEALPEHLIAPENSILSPGV